MLPLTSLSCLTFGGATGSTYPQIGMGSIRFRVFKEKKKGLCQVEMNGLVQTKRLWRLLESNVLIWLLRECALCDVSLWFWGKERLVGNEERQRNLPGNFKFWILKFVQVNILCWERQIIF